MAAPLEVLTNAQTLLIDGGISRGAYARDKQGEIVGTHSKEAETYCVIGAIAHSCRQMGVPFEMIVDTCNLFAPFMDPDMVQPWNDHASDEEVLSVVEAALNVERSRISDRIRAAA